MYRDYKIVVNGEERMLKIPNYHYNFSFWFD